MSCLSHRCSVSLLSKSGSRWAVWRRRLLSLGPRAARGHTRPLQNRLDLVDRIVCRLLISGCAFLPDIVLPTPTVGSGARGRWRILVLSVCCACVVCAGPRLARPAVFACSAVASSPRITSLPWWPRIASLPWLLCGQGRLIDPSAPTCCWRSLLAWTFFACSAVASSPRIASLPWLPRIASLPWLLCGQGRLIDTSALPAAGGLSLPGP